MGIHIDGRPVKYVADFIQNLAPICVCILSVLIFVMKCKPTEMLTKYYSFLLKHFKKMSILMLLHNCLLKTQAVTMLIILIKIKTRSRSRQDKISYGLFLSL